MLCENYTNKGIKGNRLFWELILLTIQYKPTIMKCHMELDEENVRKSAKKTTELSALDGYVCVSSFGLVVYFQLFE